MQIGHPCSPRPLILWLDLWKKANAHRQERIAKGAALWQHRCTSQEYETLKLKVVCHDWGHWRPPKNDAVANPEATCFCLFAAETWRRFYSGGPWSWEVIRPHLGQRLQSSSDDRLRDLVRVGLRGWHLDLLSHDGGGQNLYLNTLIVQAGIPLKALTGESALAPYFKKLLREAGREGRTSIPRLAATLGKDLPKTYRQQEIFELASDLVEAIVKVRLDNADPEEARRQVPLDLEDPQSRALFDALWQESEAITQAWRSQRLPMQMIRTLQQDASGQWQARSGLTVREVIPTEALASLFEHAHTELPSPLDLFLTPYHGAARRVMRLRRRDEGWRREHLPGQRPDWGAAALGEFRLICDDSPLDRPLPGSEIPPELPWVFRPNDSGGWEYAGAGGARSGNRSV